MIELLRRKAADELRPFDDLLADDAFWEEFALEIERQLAPRMLVIFFAGAEAAAKLRRPSKKTVKRKAQPAEASDFLSPEALAKLGEEAIRGYVSPFAKQITQTTYDGVRDAVIRSRRDGTGVEGVISSIEPLFSPRRAELIAVTETTRLFGLGSQAVYRAQGYTAWEWRTAEDPWVDDQCAALNGQIFPISQSFEPAHPRCRCWPTPAFVSTATPAIEAVPTTTPAAGIEWKPVMTDEEARVWVRDSAFQERLFHFTKDKSASGITSAGFRVPNSAGVYGNGIYLTTSPAAKGIGRAQWETRLEVAVNVKRPLAFKTSEFNSIIERYDLGDDDWEWREKLQGMGFDSLLIDREDGTHWVVAFDTAGVTVVQ